VKIRFQTLMDHLEPLLDGNTNATMDTNRPSRSTESHKSFPPPFSDN